MSEKQYWWDLILPELLQLIQEPWGNPLVGINRRQEVATPFAMRAFRRTLAVDALFKAGYYWESHALIRNGYEDWLQLSYLFRELGDTRCNDYKTHIHKHDARVYDAFRTICGQDAANRFFGEIPTKVSQYVGLPRSRTKSASFALLADDVGLRNVHDFVYTYLSGRSHPTGRIRELFDTSKSIAVARIPSRNPSDETRLALWLGWFTARIIVLAAREFGIDRESFCDEHLLPFVASGINLETCVLIREYSTQ